MLSFFLIMRNRQEAEPVLYQVILEIGHTHNVGGLVLDDLTDRCDGVVARVVVLGLLGFLTLDFRSHSVLDR